MALDPKLAKLNGPTITALGTILIPFDSGREMFVVEMSRAQWRTLAGQVAEQFMRDTRKVEMAAAMLAIDRHESVV